MEHNTLDKNIVENGSKRVQTRRLRLDAANRARGTDSVWFRRQMTSWLMKNGWRTTKLAAVRDDFDFLFRGIISKAVCRECSAGLSRFPWRGECDEETAVSQQSLEHTGFTHTAGLPTFLDLPPKTTILRWLRYEHIQKLNSLRIPHLL